MGTTQTDGKPRTGKVLRALGWAAAWLLALVGLVLFLGSVWVRRKFGVVSIDQALMNIPEPGKNIPGGWDLVLEGTLWIVVLPIVIWVAALLLWRWTRRPSFRSSSPKLGLAVSIAWVPVLLLLVPASGLYQGNLTFDLQTYLQARNSKMDMQDYYAVPEFDQPLIDKSNLVLIYLESVEDAMGLVPPFELNMLAPVQEATEDWQSIPALEQYAGGGWTMSGIVSTQCGIPLRSGNAHTTSAEMNVLGAETSRFLSGAVCLGDVLADAGYQNVFMGGADSAFAGKHSFLEQHGYQTIKDLNTWEAAGETEMRSDWGLSDRRLMDLAKDQLMELRDSGQPYNLTLLTLDTHDGPRPHDYCPVTTDVPMTSITECSMSQVAGFLEFMEDEGFLEDTAVVVMGDHLKFVAETNSFWDELRPLENRTIFNRFHSPEEVKVVDTFTDQLDMYPTILDLMGLDPVDGRAGLGVSALEKGQPKGSVRSLSPDQYHELLFSRSLDFYNRMWGQLPN
ncbi:sulfatase-like hydrolase/transferase [Actinomyces sp. F1_1611]